MMSEDGQRREPSRQDNPESGGGESEEMLSGGGEPKRLPGSKRLQTLFKQGIRYVIVGFSSFALEFLLFAALHELVGLHVVLSNVIAITGASIYNFIMSRSWTFKSTSSLLRSAILYTLLFIWNQFFSSWAILLLMDVDLSAMLAKVLTMAVIVCWNFVLYRKVVFI